MAWNCLGATITYSKLCLHCTSVPSLNSAQKWHFPAETSTFKFVKKEQEQNTHVGSHQLQEHKGRQAVFEKRAFLVSWDGNHPLSQRPWGAGGVRCGGFQTPEPGFQKNSRFMGSQDPWWYVSYANRGYRIFQEKLDVQTWRTTLSQAFKLATFSRPEVQRFPNSPNPTGRLSQTLQYKFFQVLWLLIHLLNVKFPDRSTLHT